ALGGGGELVGHEAEQPTIGVRECLTVAEIESQYSDRLCPEGKWQRYGRGEAELASRVPPILELGISEHIGDIHWLVFQDGSAGRTVAGFDTHRAEVGGIALRPVVSRDDSQQI